MGEQSVKVVHLLLIVLHELSQAKLLSRQSFPVASSVLRSARICSQLDKAFILDTCYTEVGRPRHRIQSLPWKNHFLKQEICENSQVTTCLLGFQSGWVDLTHDLTRGAIHLSSMEVTEVSPH